MAACSLSSSLLAALPLKPSAAHRLPAAPVRTSTGGAGSFARLPSLRWSTEKERSARRFPALASSLSDDLRPALDENPEGIISGEWPGSFSLLSYDDLRAYLETEVISKETKPSALLRDVMSSQIRTATPGQTLEQINGHFEVVSGLPVVDEQLRCIGVVSKKDKAKARLGLKSKVSEVMSSPAITLPPSKTVLDAAALMLKMKIHRIPILDEQQKVIGMVTRTDIFQALEAEKK